MESIKLSVIYPELYPVNIKKRVGKAIFWGLLPIEPIVEVVLVSTSLLLDKIKRKPKNEDWIEFRLDEIEFKSKEEHWNFKLAAINRLEIHYHHNLVIGAEESADEEQLKKQISRVKFRVEETNYEVFYDSKKKVIKKLCKALYDKGIKLKEYQNGKRVFLGRQPNYKEVQELKKKYNLEW